MNLKTTALIAILALLGATPSFSQAWSNPGAMFNEIPAVVGVPVDEAGEARPPFLDFVRWKRHAKRRKHPARGEAALGAVTDDATAWKALLSKIVEHPTNKESISVNGNDYDLFALDTNTPVEGQNCPAGTTPENTAFVAKPKQAGDGDVYPVRLVSFCLNLKSPGDFLNIDADEDAKILNVEIYNNARSFDSKMNAGAGKAALQAYVGKMIELFESLRD